MAGGHRRRSIFSATLLFGLSWPNSLSQENHLPLTIPVKVISGLVLMPGEVNHSIPLGVILDTGSSISIVNPSAAGKSGLAATHSTEAAGIARGSNQTLQISNDCELRWGIGEDQLRLVRQQCATMNIDYIAAQVGDRVDGIFGSNLFLHYVIAIDYEQQRVTFSPSATGTPPGDSAIPIEISNNVPYVQASIQGEDGKKVPARFLIDSGTAGAIILSKKFVDAHPGLVAPAHFVDTPTVTAVGGAIHSSRARLPELILGHFVLHGVVAVVPESSLGVLSDANVAGFIGAEILDRFTVIWDYAGKNMFLSPNHAFGTPFDTDCSGLHLVSAGPEYQKVFIDSVLPGSPAAMSGLKPNDEIVAVNGAVGLPLWQVSRAFRQADTSVLIAVQRETRIVKFTLPLRSPFSKTD
jgi:PDZ domain/Aspartyl protease